MKDFDKKNSDNIENINLDALHDYFRNLNDVQTNVNDTGIDNDTLPPEHIDMILNSDIIRDEIKNVIANLKNNKASGYDDVLNEHIKCTVDIMLPIYQKLFNLVLNFSAIPEAWTQGIIQPIYKKKGDIKDPTSYRPITLVSCLGKTFTAVLNTRLGRLADEVELISEAQTGFRKGYSTLDNMFTLYALISLYFSFG